MKRLITLVLILIGNLSLWSQTEGDFPTQYANGKIYIGTDSELAANLREGNRFVSGRIGLAGQYFVNENLALGLSIGFGGSRSYFDNDATVFRNNSLRLSSYWQAFIYPVGGRSTAVQPFVQIVLGLGRGRSQSVPETGTPQNTPMGTSSLGLAPGLSIALPNDALLNISTSLLRLGLSRQGKGNTAERTAFLSGGLNSGISVAYLKNL